MEQTDNTTYMDEIPNDTIEYVKGLEESIESLNAQVEELKNKNLYLLADMQNMKRQNTNALNAIEDRSIAKAVRQLLFILDDLNRAVQYAKDDTCDLQGIKCIVNHFNTRLNVLKIEKVEPNMGDMFDGDTMVAVATLTNNDDTNMYKDNQVVLVQSIGYKINDTMIRYPEVHVYKDAE